MHTTRQSFNLLLIALTLSIMPAFADSLEINASTAVGQPKYAQRIKDLGEQIRLVQSKGLITPADQTKFLDRITQLSTMEVSARKGGFPKPASDELEKSITELNAEVFKASHKNSPVNAGQAEKEVHDPNLIPAYSDPKLQPNSGDVSK